MKVLQNKGRYKILTSLVFLRNCLLIIEKAGRTCYKSEVGKITLETAKKFVQLIMKKNHFSVLEHFSLTVKFFNVSRGFAFELVRHRLCSFSQESTRFVDYIKGDGNPDLERFQCKFVLPPHCNINKKILMPNGTKMSPRDMFQVVESFYRALRQNGWKPEDARQILPNALTADIVVTANIREWRHIFYMRTAKPAHWEIRAVMVKLLVDLQKNVPVIFDDFVLAGNDDNGVPFYTCQYKDDN